MSCIIKGKTNRQIASHLHIAESTVKSHLTSIYIKLNVSNRTAAAMVGLETTSESRTVAG